jgi:hypothetical protein
MAHTANAIKNKKSQIEMVISPDMAPAYFIYRAFGI